jgi:hypothetical protein
MINVQTHGAMNRLRSECADPMLPELPQRRRERCIERKYCRMAAFSLYRVRAHLFAGFFRFVESASQGESSILVAVNVFMWIVPPGVFWGALAVWLLLL